MQRHTRNQPSTIHCFFLGGGGETRPKPPVRIHHLDLPHEQSNFSCNLCNSPLPFLQNRPTILFSLISSRPINFTSAKNGRLPFLVLPSSRQGRQQPVRVSPMHPPLPQKGPKMGHLCSDLLLKKDTPGQKRGTEEPPPQRSRPAYPVCSCWSPEPTNTVLLSLTPQPNSGSPLPNYPSQLCTALPFHFP